MCKNLLKRVKIHIDQEVHNIVACLTPPVFTVQTRRVHLVCNITLLHNIVIRFIANVLGSTTHSIGSDQGQVAVIAV